MNQFLIAPLVLCLAISSHCLAAGRAPQNLTDDSAAPEQVAAEVVTNMLFGEQDKQVLTEYLRNRYHGGNEDNYDDQPGKKHKQKSLPPGLRKKLERGGELPPGWQKKVARGEVLNEDIYYNHSSSLPEEILRRLPANPEGTSVQQIDDRIVRVMDATRTVLDVFYLVNPQ